MCIRRLSQSLNRLFVQQEFTNALKTIVIYDMSSFHKHSVNDLCKTDVVIVLAGIIEERRGKTRPYTQNLKAMSGSDPIPAAPTTTSYKEAPTIEGTWIRNMASGPEIYVGNKGEPFSNLKSVFVAVG